MGKKYIFLMMIKRSAISLSNVKAVIVQDQQKQIFENIEIDTVKKRVSQISLGLALCKIAVQAQEGMLAITSNQLHGYIFTNDIQSLRCQESKHKVLYIFFIHLIDYFLVLEFVDEFHRGEIQAFRAKRNWNCPKRILELFLLR